MKNYLKVMLAGLFLLLSSAAQAVPITVDPGAYDQGSPWNRYYIDGVVNTGTKALDLAVGTHWMQIGAQKGRFNFDVAGDGTVTSTNTFAVTTGVGSITFNTVMISVDPVAYASYWGLWGSSDPYLTGPQSIPVVRGLSFSLIIGAPLDDKGGNTTVFDVGVDGTITSSDTNVFTGGYRQIRFKNTTISIDPQGYQGTWWLSSYRHNHKDPAVTAPLNLVVVPNNTYFVYVHYSGVAHVLFGAGHAVKISVDAGGNITSTRPASMMATGNALVFQTRPVVIDPQAYRGNWSMGTAIPGSGYNSGLVNAQLVVGIPYFFTIDTTDTYGHRGANPAAGNFGYIRIDLDAAGNLTSSWPGAVVASGNRLIFNNVTINIDAAGFSGSWRSRWINQFNMQQGKQSIVVVPDWRYTLSLSGESSLSSYIPWSFFRVDKGGNVFSENQVAFKADGTSNTLTFNTVSVTLDTAATASGYMSFTKGFTYTSPTTFNVVQGLSYRFFANGYSLDYLNTDGLPLFRVNADCTVSGFPQTLKNGAGATMDTSAWTWTCANTAPFANAGASQLVEQTSPTGALVTLNGSASSDADGDVLTYTWSGSFGSASGVTPVVQFPAGTNNANLIVNDGTVDSVASSVIITVQDTIAPAVIAPLAVSIEATAVQTAAVIGTATATDAVGVVSITNNAPATYPLGTTTVTWTATDAAGNAGIATQAVTVLDTTAPVITAPIAVAANAVAIQTAVLIGTATATDAFPVTITSNAPATFPVGITTIIWTATDSHGNSATATQLVTVVDTLAPVITVTPVGGGGVTAIDNVDGVVIAITNQLTPTLPGAHIITWTATDAAGNTSTFAETVVIAGPINGGGGLGGNNQGAGNAGSNKHSDDDKDSEEDDSDDDDDEKDSDDDDEEDDDD